MNNLKQLRYQAFFFPLVCISFFATTASLFGQQVIQQPYPTYQQLPQYTPVSPSPSAPAVQPQYPIQQGTIIYGQPVQGGQIIDGQSVQPGVIVTPPSTQQAQPGVNDEAQRLAEAKRIAEAKRLEEIKRLVAENKRLEALVVDNGRAEAKRLEESRRLYAENKRLLQMVANNRKQEQEFKRLEGELRKATSELSLMQEAEAAKPAATKPEAPAQNRRIQQQQKKISQLSFDYKKALQQNESLAGQIKTLTDESSNLRAQLIDQSDSQSAQGMGLKQLQSKLTTTTNAFGELQQKNEAMSSEFSRVQGLYESTNTDNAALSTDNAELKKRIADLTSENQGISQQLSEYANASTQSTERDADADDDADLKTSLAVNHDSAVSDLRTENQQLLALNEKANQQNEFLNRRIAELEGSVNELTVDNNDRKAASTEIASSFDALDSVSDQAGSSSGKYNIMNWLLPFLAIGLSIGLYVFLTEEHRGTSRPLVTGGNSRDDQRK